MQDNHLFEYAVIRVMPRVEREEFINVGVILLCRKQQFLKAVFSLNPGRLHAFCNELDLTEIEANLNAFVRICEGGEQAGTIGMMNQAERFRWLTALRSTIVQTSRVHPGFSANPQQALEALFAKMVL